MAFLSAGTSFKINDQIIKAALSIPALGTTPNNIDITTLDSEGNTESLLGLQNLSSLSFTFLMEVDNFQAALDTEDTEDTNYAVEFPSGLVCTFSGSHTAYPMELQPNQPEKFKIDIAVKGKISKSFKTAAQTTAATNEGSETTNEGDN